jgi:hypothetical protein
MIKIVYWPSNGTYTVGFSRTACAFGDYIASIYRSMVQILTALKASGEPVEAPLDTTGELRLKYNPATKLTEVTLAGTNDDWTSAPQIPFKADTEINVQSEPFNGLTSI